MIRFIDLTGQIYLDDEEKSFAFFDTITDKFCEFSGNQYWDNIEDFKNDYTGNEIDRFLRLIPPSQKYDWKETKIVLGDKEMKLNKPSYESLKDWDRFHAFAMSLPLLNHYYCGNRGKWQQIEDLEKQLRIALENEDYITAESIKQSLKGLKNSNQ
ncbi:hypothetical protein EGI16_21560 [Chryseobacterium sp. G0240]|uniref:hypothetical protein n=1 Tax=Chryseobacterium sp. G0240 TaxID=2487066 RepID=UPI000F4561D3|nr:hypothetical protein [Chryseobacterium sp. G0240]ROH98267.1 hypothetical protein EGI16_21560 [Chryseobacterium sp. G0240]